MNTDKYFNFTHNKSNIMSIKNVLEVVILSDEESKIVKLNDLLSKFYTLEITQVFRHPAEAIEYLNNQCPTILFIDMAYKDILHDVRKPPFIVGLCDAIYTKKVKQFLKMGFFELFYAPYTEAELNRIMGKILNIYGIYNNVDRRMLQLVKEEASSYNAEEPQKESIFITGTRNEESVRVFYDKVLYIEKEGNHVCIHFEDNTLKYFRSNLKKFMSYFPKSNFQKINHSIVVNLNKVTRRYKNFLFINDEFKFAVSRSFKKNIHDVLI